MGLSNRLAVLVLGLALMGVPPGFGSLEALKKAHEARKQGKFTEARKQFASVAGRRQTSPKDRQEAGYWLAFCSVALKAPEQAITDLHWFLDAFSTKGPAYIPDALYVLGRTYELVGKPREAAQQYQRCLEHPAAARTGFSAKARQGIERVGEMLEEDKKRGTPKRPRVYRESERFDPYSRKPISAEQFDRVKQFSQRLSQRESPASAAVVLTQEDRLLPMVQRLFDMYARFQEEEKAREELRKKAESGTP